MTTLMLRCALALGIAGALALAVADDADAKSRRKVWKKPRAQVLVEQPYVPYVREPGCVTMYDSSRSALPDYMNPACENAFRRLYPPR